MAPDDPKINEHEPIRIRDPLYRELYANTCFIRMGPFDVTLLFARNTEISPNVMGQVDQAAITISPQQFKALASVMQETFIAYENAFGKLEISEDQTASILDSKQMTTQLEMLKESMKSQRSKIAAAFDVKTPEKSVAPDIPHAPTKGRRPKKF